MTVLNSKFNLVTKDSLPLAMGGIWDVLVPSEIALAKAAGSGAGVPDSTGTMQLGTIPGGKIMELNSSFQLVLANSQDLTANFRKMFWVVFEGDDDYSGAQAGAITVVHGGLRMETTEFVVGPTYTPGMPLIASSGQLTVKAAANDHIQEVGWVASGVSQDGILDCYLAQGM
jgi:hypothetical protein